MASTDLTHSDWFDYLQQSMQATSEEIDYLKRLHELRLKHQRSEKKRIDPFLPSIIIDDFLYHGHLGHAQNMKQLKAFDIRHIISVCDLPLKKEIVDHFDVLSINLEDIHEADIRQHFNRTNEFLHACRFNNEKVLVHCQMGISRSSSIVLAYLLKYHHDTLHEAYDNLLERRRFAQPSDSFFLQLIRYEKELHKNKTSDTAQNPIK